MTDPTVPTLTPSILTSSPMVRLAASSKMARTVYPPPLPPAEVASRTITTSAATQATPATATTPLLNPSFCVLNPTYLCVDNEERAAHPVDGPPLPAVLRRYAQPRSPEHVVPLLSSKSCRRPPSSEDDRRDVFRSYLRGRPISSGTVAWLSGDCFPAEEFQFGLDREAALRALLRHRAVGHQFFALHEGGADLDLDEFHRPVRAPGTVATSGTSVVSTRPDPAAEPNFPVDRSSIDAGEVPSA